MVDEATLEADAAEDQPNLELEADSEATPPEESAGDETADEGPFLAVNDRTTYKTREEAVRGFREAGDRLASYSRFGQPDDIAQKLARLEATERLLGPEKNGASNKDDLYEGIDKENRPAWDNSFKKHADYLRSQGFVPKDELRDFIREQNQQATVEHEARSAFRELAKERGLELDAETTAALEEALAGMAQRKPELRQKFLAGDGKGFAEDAFRALYGEPPKASSGRSRDGTGRFAKAAEYGEAKEKTGKLPSAPSKGASATAETGPDEAMRAKLINPDFRRQKAQEMLDRIRAGG